jgi:hypothetical protein
MNRLQVLDTSHLDPIPFDHLAKMGYFLGSCFDHSYMVAVFLPFWPVVFAWYQGVFSRNQDCIVVVSDIRYSQAHALRSAVGLCIFPGFGVGTNT